VAGAGPDRAIVRQKRKSLWGATKGTFEIVGDVVGPVVDDWDEEREWRNITGPLKVSKAKVRPLSFSSPPLRGRGRVRGK